MGLLIANAKDILINIAVYAILFNIIYSILFSGIKYPKTISIIAYIIVMEIKLFISTTRLTLFTFCILIIVYLILGIIIVKILDEMANYKPKKSFIIIGVILGYVAELLLVKILFMAISVLIDIIIIIIWLAKHYLKTCFSVIFNIY